MPYAIVPYKSGYRLRNVLTGEHMSQKPMTKTQATRQAIAIYLSEMQHKSANPKLQRAIKHNLTGGHHDLLGNAIAHNAYKIHCGDKGVHPFAET